MKGLYRNSGGKDIKGIIRKILKDNNYSEIERSTDGVMITAIIKYFFKQLKVAILRSDLIDEMLKKETFKDQLALSELGECL